MSKIDYEKELNEQQYEAVRTTEGPVLILAGAGTGKTNTLKYRAAYLIEHGVNPENILILTFTNRAANEIKTRVVKMLGEDGLKIKACTYHGFCAEFLRKHADLIEIDDNFTILSSSDSEDAVNVVSAEIPETDEKGFPTAKQSMRIFSMVRNTNREFDEIVYDVNPKFCEYIDYIKELFILYNEYKEAHNQLDYNDLIYYTNQILELNPSLKKEYCEKYKYKMVDEYQDTNDIQFRLINNLCGFGNRNIAVVGDPAQCIMGFQGANVENILNFPDKFKGCRVVKLEKNYRSTQEILDMANAVLTMMPSELNLTLKANGKTGKRPSLYGTFSPAQEAKLVCEKVKEDYERQHDSINDIAVLVRQSFDSFLIEGELVKSGIPYRKYGGVKLMEKVYMRDILAFLKVSVNPKDEIAWFRILNLCKGVGKSISNKIVAEIIKDGPKYLVNPIHMGKKYDDDFQTIFNIYETLKTKSLYDQVSYLLTVYFALQEELIENKKISSDKKKTELNTNEANREEAEILYDFIAPYKETKLFLADIILEQPVDESEGALTISTIHSAKGKEFKKVYFCGCIDRQRDHQNAKVEQEERRCFYVAITRAKEDLIFTYSKTSNNRDNEVSSFLEESSEIMLTYDKQRFGYRTQSTRLNNLSRRNGYSQYRNYF